MEVLVKCNNVGISAHKVRKVTIQLGVKEHPMLQGFYGLMRKKKLA